MPELKVIIDLDEYNSLKSQETKAIEAIKRDMKRINDECGSPCVIEIRKYPSWRYDPFSDLSYVVRPNTKSEEISEQCKFVAELIDERDNLLEKIEKYKAIEKERDTLSDTLKSLKKTLWYKIGKILFLQ